MAPTADQFGRYLNERMANWRTEYPYLYAAVRFFSARIPAISSESWGLDKVWGAIDTRVKLRNIFDGNISLPGVPTPRPSHKRIYARALDDLGLAGFELKCAIARVYGDDLEEAISRSVTNGGKLKEEIEKLNDGDCVISFNYDVLAERLLRARNVRMKIVTQSNLRNGLDSVLLCKPHGSLSWKLYVPGRMAPVLEPYDEAIKSSGVDYRPEYDAELQPGIIAPVPFKEQIAIPEIQGSVPDFYQLVIAQWKVLLDSITQADEMVVMGYGFPVEDFHAIHVFGEAAARRSKKFSVSVYSRSKFTSIKKRLVGMFRNVEVQNAGPVTP